MKNINRMVRETHHHSLSLVCSAAFLLVVLGSSHVFGADAFTTRAENFVSTTVLMWTRILGSLAIIGGVCGLIYNRHNIQEKLGMFLSAIAVGALIFGIPEIINHVYGMFASSSIDALKQ